MLLLQLEAWLKFHRRLIAGRTLLTDRVLGLAFAPQRTFEIARSALRTFVQVSLNVFLATPPRLAVLLNSMPALSVHQYAVLKGTVT